MTGDRPQGHNRVDVDKSMFKDFYYGIRISWRGGFFPEVHVNLTSYHRTYNVRLADSRRPEYSSERSEAKLVYGAPKRWERKESVWGTIVLCAHKYDQPDGMKNGQMGLHETPDPSDDW